MSQIYLYFHIDKTKGILYHYYVLKKQKRGRFIVKKSKFVKTVAVITAVLSSFGTLTTYASDETPVSEDILNNVAFDDIKCYEIDQDIADKVNQSVAQITRKTKKTPLESSSVAERDWTVYDDEYCLTTMTESEKAYYQRLENTSVSYISDDTLNATQLFADYGFNQYITKGTTYSDLGLSQDEATMVARWFLNNNAQYYFYNREILYSNQDVYIVCYDDMADGEKRAEITNQMFTTIDSWLTTINDGNKTTYQKIETANDLICDEVDYDFNDYDQSLYSPVILKTTVCAGYSRLMSVLMNGSGVPTSVLTGNNHAWNTVRFGDGKYYGVDVTWNDSIGRRRLFGCSNENMKQFDTMGEHTRKTDFARFEPAGEDTDYNPNFLTAPKISVAPVSNNVERISWDTVDNATHYRCEVASDNTFKNIVTSKTTTATTFTAKGLSANTSYYVRVRAFIIHSDGSRTYSSFGKKTFLTTVTLSNPVVTLEPVSDTSFKITWKKVPNATNYRCFIATDSKFKNVIINKTTSAKSFTPTELTSGKTYYVKVRAFVTRPNGNRIYSGYSETLSIRL